MANKSPLVLNGGAVEQLQAGDGIIAAAFASSGAVVLSPSGSGGLQIGTDGNARGKTAVDLQAFRDADTQVASGNYSAILGGYYCTCSGTGAGIVGSARSSNDAENSGIVGGYNITITSSGFYSAAIGGRNSYIDSPFSAAFGYYSRTRFQSQISQSGGRFSNVGDAQSSAVVMRNITTNDTPVELFLDGVALRLVVPNYTTWLATVEVVGLQTNGDRTTYGLIWNGIITKVTGNVSLTNAATLSEFLNDMAWSCSISADTVNQSLKIEVQGGEADTVRWVARVGLVEVTG